MTGPDPDPTGYLDIFWPSEKNLFKKKIKILNFFSFLRCQNSYDQDISDGSGSADP
jgi:hypothetical protein